MTKVQTALGVFLILLSALLVSLVHSAWLSVYPILGAGDLALPVPTTIALKLSGSLVLSVVALLFLSVVFVSSSIRKLEHHLLHIVFAIHLVWFGYILFIFWALALPFINVEFSL